MEVPLMLIHPQVDLIFTRIKPLFIEQYSIFKLICETEDTNYYFDVSVDQFKEALDIFSRFFIDPLMTESSTERELLAVDSENSNSLLNDTWRYSQLRNLASNSKHPSSKFGTGNKETLSHANTRAALLEFHAHHYKASNMGLCILSNGS
jgi:insulysin